MAGERVDELARGLDKRPWCDARDRTVPTDESLREELAGLYEALRLLRRRIMDGDRHRPD